MGGFFDLYRMMMGWWSSVTAIPAPTIRDVDPAEEFVFPPRSADLLFVRTADFTFNPRSADFVFGERVNG